MKRTDPLGRLVNTSVIGMKRQRLYGTGVSISTPTGAVTRWTPCALCIPYCKTGRDGSGCCLRTMLNQVLFARNEESCINEKKAVATADGFPVKPQEDKKRIDQIVTLISSDEDKTREGVHMLRELVSKTKEIAPDAGLLRDR